RPGMEHPWHFDTNEYTVSTPACGPRGDRFRHVRRAGGTVRESTTQDVFFRVEHGAGERCR
ncbi:arpA protein, partial [Streptomyces sp. NPDC007168]